MSVIIDANAVSMTFDSKNARHSDFKPVFDHLLDRRSRVKLTYGGTKYLAEVNGFRKFLALFVELNKIGKLNPIPCPVVDQKLSEIEKKSLKKEEVSKTIDTMMGI